MPPCRLILLFSLTLFALAAAAEESPTVAAPPLEHLAGKDIKFAPAPVVAEEPTVFETKSAEAPIVLSPYLVKELPDRTYFELSSALRQRRRLQSHALYKKPGVELLLPPTVEMAVPLGAAHHDPIPRLNLILVRLRW